MTTLQSRLAGLLFHHAYQWLRQAGRVLHLLWLEVTGAVFLGLAAFAAPSALKEWRAFQAGGPLWKPAASALFLIMMVSFGAYSFFKARRLR